jgi:DNA replicative helicase MCM subunit Mcm2 (Cdc46/Mcm family)
MISSILHIVDILLQGDTLANSNFKPVWIKKETKEDLEKLYDKVLDYFNNHKTEDVSLEELKGKFKVEDIFLVDILDELKEDGEIYEPKEGIYRYL